MTTTREEQAAVELGTTDVTPTVARVMVASFAITLMAMPAAQWAGELRAFALGDRNSPWPSAAEILTAPTVVFQRWSQDDPGGMVGKTLAANAELLAEIQRYETSLEDRSLTTTVLLGPTRSRLARWFGWGTDDAWVGHDGWLFYRPDLDHSTGPPFLAPDVLAHRRRGGREFSARRHPDPRPAILDFARQLARQDIRLVLVPTPTKAMVHPEHFGVRTDADQPPMHNRSYLELVQTLEDNGVTVFDPLPILVHRHQQTGEDQFLSTDTHWRPEAMEAVAQALAAELVNRKHVNADTPIPGRTRTTMQVTGQGDLQTMMKLGSGPTVFQTQTVTLNQVLMTDGRSHWQPDPTARVLLLGDSYTNIYSLEPMGWGQSAGFAEQLSWHLGQPVDRISRNADGAHATRRQLASDPNRLDGKTIVVWQLAVREFSSGDWPPIGPGTPGRNTGSTRSRDVVDFRGTVLATSGVPTPGTVPYRDAVLSLHVTDGKGGQRIVFCMGMKDNQLVPAARLRPGDVLTARLIPWTTVEKTYGRLVRIELDDPEFRLVDLPTFWGDLK